jgi:hypothetical protein
MSDPVQLALISSIPPTLAGLAALIVGIRNSRKSSAENSLIIKKSDEIHTLTNSNLTSVKAELVAASERIKALESLVTSMAAARP